MNKIIFIFLLSIIACSFPVENNLQLEDFLKAFDYSMIEEIWDKIKIYVHKVVNFLKQIGLYDPIINIIQKYGRAYGMEYCTSFKIPERICKDIIDILLKVIQ